MDIHVLGSFFGWCSIINAGILLYWSSIVIFAPDWLYRITDKWISISKERLMTIHYVLLGVFKLMLVFFNAVPYFALQIAA